MVGALVVGAGGCGGFCRCLTSPALARRHHEQSRCDSCRSQPSHRVSPFSTSRSIRVASASPGQRFRSGLTPGHCTEPGHQRMARRRLHLRHEPLEVWLPPTHHRIKASQPPTCATTESKISSTATRRYPGKVHPASALTARLDTFRTSARCPFRAAQRKAASDGRSVRVA